jgi:hypothetical protein
MYTEPKLRARAELRNNPGLLDAIKRVSLVSWALFHHSGLFSNFLGESAVFCAQVGQWKAAP